MLLTAHQTNSVKREPNSEQTSWIPRVLKSPARPGEAVNIRPSSCLTLGNRPTLLALVPFEGLFNEVLLFPVNYTVAASVSRMRSPVFEGIKMTESSARPSPGAPGCVSGLRSDSLSESQDPHQASSGSHGGALLDVTPGFTYAWHTWAVCDFSRRGSEWLVESRTRLLHLSGRI